MLLSGEAFPHICILLRQIFVYWALGILIAEWLSEGMSVGSAAAFMIAGPGTKLTNLGALKSSLGIRNFVLYIAYVIAFAAITGWLIDIFRIFI